MKTTITTLRTVVFAVVIGAPLSSSALWAAEEKALRPEIEQLTQTVSEKLQAAADRLGLTSEQRDKIAGIRSSHEEQFKALRPAAVAASGGTEVDQFNSDAGAT